MTGGIARVSGILNMTKVNEFFSANYAEAREKFLAAATAAGASLAAIENPNTGPDGGRLATDTAWLGPASASRLLVLNSATHGVEGFCGSGAQVGLLRGGDLDKLPADTAVLLVHAINPFGFAHLRRVNEDNVDINRNFIDHDTPHPANEPYDSVHALLVPADWDGPARAAADRGIDDYIAARGEFTFQAAVSGGQYGHADGLFYGGRAPVWSNRVLRRIIDSQAGGRAQVGFIDFHTGLGPRGYGEPIFVGQPDSADHRRARDWYGDQLTSPEVGNSTSAEVQGTLANAFTATLPAGTAFTGIALEYGTVPVLDVLNALRADNWLYLHGDTASPLGRDIKAQIRAAFYGDDDAWKADVFARAREIVAKGLTGLANG